MYNWKNALCKKTSHQLKDSRYKLKDELCLCLAEMNNVDYSETNEWVNEWLNVRNWYGGLKHATNMTYHMFAST